jgi:hypothetical protein
MAKLIYLQQVITLIGLFDPNVSMSHEVETYINGLSTIVRNKIKSQMIDSINNNSVTASDIKRIAAFTPSSDLAAMELFTAIYLHAFEDGEEPDIDDYRL